MHLWLLVTELVNCLNILKVVELVQRRCRGLADQKKLQHEQVAVKVLDLDYLILFTFVIVENLGDLCFCFRPGVQDVVKDM